MSVKTACDCPQVVISLWRHNNARCATCDVIIARMRSASAILNPSGPLIVIIVCAINILRLILKDIFLPKRIIFTNLEVGVAAARHNFNGCKLLKLNNKKYNSCVVNWFASNKVWHVDPYVVAVGAQRVNLKAREMIYHWPRKRYFEKAISKHCFSSPDACCWWLYLSHFF